jgi:8-oxo-dGTP diphosphatase
MPERLAVNSRKVGGGMNVQQGFRDTLDSLLRQDDPGNKSTSARFIERLADGRLTRDENPADHFCVYFAAYDPELPGVFMGEHIKAGLWLFNGGHVDLGEVPAEALRREMDEEWGKGVCVTRVSSPQLLSITLIDNPARQTCRTHYDIWYFVEVSQETFAPSRARLAEEFHQCRWLTLADAGQMVTDPNTQRALEFLKSNCCK